LADIGGFNMAQRQGLFGASMRLTLRARCTRAKTLPMFLSNCASHPNLRAPHIKKPPQGRLFYMAEKERVSSNQLLVILEQWNTLLKTICLNKSPAVT